MLEATYTMDDIIHKIKPTHPPFRIMNGWKNHALCLNLH
jgi:hypothetical protein